MEMKNNMVTDYGSEKADKQKELNETMTITKKSPDEYEQKIKNLTVKGE